MSNKLIAENTGSAEKKNDLTYLENLTSFIDYLSHLKSELGKIPKQGSLEVVNENTWKQAKKMILELFPFDSQPAIIEQLIYGMYKYFPSIFAWIDFEKYLPPSKFYGDNWGDWEFLRNRTKPERMLIKLRNANNMLNEIWMETFMTWYAMDIFKRDMIVFIDYLISLWKSVQEVQDKLSWYTQSVQRILDQSHKS